MGRLVFRCASWWEFGSRCISFVMFGGQRLDAPLRRCEVARFRSLSDPGTNRIQIHIHAAGQQCCVITQFHGTESSLPETSSTRPYNSVFAEVNKSA
jgi:hypothetical protein